MFFLPTLRNALWSLHPWPRFRSLFSPVSLAPALNFSTALEAVTFFHPSKLLHLYAIGLGCPFPSYLPSKLLFTPEDSASWSLPLWCLTQIQEIVHPFPVSPEVLAPSSGEDSEWKESLGQVSATPQANSFNTVSLTPNSLVPVTFHPLGSWLHF